MKTWTVTLRWGPTFEQTFKFGTNGWAAHRFFDGAPARGKSIDQEVGG